MHISVNLESVHLTMTTVYGRGVFSCWRNLATRHSTQMQVMGRWEALGGNCQMMGNVWVASICWAGLPTMQGLLVVQSQVKGYCVLSPLMELSPRVGLPVTRYLGWEVSRATAFV